MNARRHDGGAALRKADPVEAFAGIGRYDRERRDMSATVDDVVSYLLRLPLHEAWSGGRPLLAHGRGDISLRLANCVSEISARGAELLSSPSSCGRSTAPSAAVPGIVDPVLAHLAAAIAVSPASHGSEHLIGHVLAAVRAHLSAKYSHVASPAKAGKARALSDGQLRLAKTLLAANAGRELRLTDVAKACGLSRQYFTMAFKASTGVTPHRWLQQYRIEAAKRLLCEGALPIADIAISCGFADQSHFTRVFAASVGASPAAWRREQRGR